MDWSCSRGRSALFSGAITFLPLIIMLSSIKFDKLSSALPGRSSRYGSQETRILVFLLHLPPEPLSEVRPWPLPISARDVDLDLPNGVKLTCCCPPTYQHAGLPGPLFHSTGMFVTARPGNLLSLPLSMQKTSATQPLSPGISTSSGASRAFSLTSAADYAYESPSHSTILRSICYATISCNLEGVIVTFAHLSTTISGLCVRGAESNFRFLLLLLLFLHFLLSLSNRSATCQRY